MRLPIARNSSCNKTLKATTLIKIETDSHNATLLHKIEQIHQIILNYRPFLNDAKAVYLYKSTTLLKYQLKTCFDRSILIIRQKWIRPFFLNLF